MEKWIRNILIVIIILIVLNYVSGLREEWEENNCELDFTTYTYNDGCASACSSKCFNEGFPHSDGGYFEPYLTGEEMLDFELYKQCTCFCGGCRE